jgi:SEP domain/UBX domain
MFKPIAYMLTLMIRIYRRIICVCSCSGLAVQPNNADDPDRDAVFGIAEDATSETSSQVRRTITMVSFRCTIVCFVFLTDEAVWRLFERHVNLASNNPVVASSEQYRDGFVVDDGPYRRLDDPENADFLRSLAMGRTPRELMHDAEGGNVTVGLIDKRSEEYVEEFRSFSGQGTSLGTTVPAGDSNTFDPLVLSEPPLTDDGGPVTSIAVRLVNGGRRVVRINTASTVQDLASHLRDASEAPFRLVTGFPPRPLEDGTATIEAAGLKGAQVSMQTAS